MLARMSSAVLDQTNGLVLPLWVLVQFELAREGVCAAADVLLRQRGEPTFDLTIEQVLHLGKVTMQVAIFLNQ